jgi:hypothetical protein
MSIVPKAVAVVALLAGAALAPAAPAAESAASKSKDAAGAPAAKGAAPAVPSRASASGAKAPAKSAPKTLQEITIEGEVRLPEVLFITSRDVERPLDWLAGYVDAEDRAAAHAEHAPVRVYVLPAAPVDSAAAAEDVGAELRFHSPETESAR